MNSAETFYAVDRNAWHAWLLENHRAKKLVWLIYYKMHTGKASVPYEDSVEEALCFGWIDSTVKRFDDERYCRKFIPRTKNSQWSELNKRRAEKTISECRVCEGGKARIDEAKQSGEWFRTPRERDELELPLFFRDMLEKNKKAFDYFNSLAPSYRRNYIGWVSSPKREETRMKRLAEALIYLEANKKLPLK